MEKLTNNSDNPENQVININRFIRSERYRAWIDDNNIGHIKILKRVNFATLISVLMEIAIM
jgi:hypothetical protein